MKINLKNSAKVDTALKHVNGLSASFCYTRAKELRALAERAESVMSERGVNKRNFRGVVLKARQDGPYSNRYKYSANATVVNLRRSSGAWFLVEARLSSVSPCAYEIFHLSVPPEARSDIVSYAMRGISQCTIDSQEL